MNFLADVIIIYLLFQIVWWAVGPAFTRWALVSFAKKVQSDSRRRYNAYGQSSEPGFEKEFFVTQNMKAKVPRQPGATAEKQKHDISDIAEEVDFEELG